MDTPHAAGAVEPGENQSVLSVLAADLERPENRYITTPLIELITAGDLPEPALKDFAVLRWPFQAHANPAMMLSHACFLAGEDVHHLLGNVYDEIFRPKGEGDHPGLWVQFALKLGATQHELDKAAARPLAEVIGFARTMTHFCRQSAAEALATWYADEEQLPEALGALAFALRRHYRLDDDTIEYFIEHVRADLDHSDAAEALMARYIRTPEELARARRAASATLWAWREMHEGILRELRRRHEI